MAAKKPPAKTPAKRALPKKASNVPVPRRGPGGSVSPFDPSVVDTICELIAEGKRLHEIGAMRGLPSRWTIMRWMGEKPEFMERVARARQVMVGDYLADIIDLAERRTGDPIELQERKLEVDTKKWAVTKLYPKVFGGTPPTPPGDVNVQVNNTTVHNDNRSLYAGLTPSLPARTE